MTTDELRIALTRYHQDDRNFVMAADYQAILDFIAWLEDSKDA